MFIRNSFIPIVYAYFFIIFKLPILKVKYLYSTPTYIIPPIT